MHALSFAVTDLVSGFADLTVYSCLLAEKILESGIRLLRRPQHVNATLELSFKKAIKCLNFWAALSFVLARYTLQ